MSTKFYIKDNNGIYLSTDGKIRYTLLEGKALYDFLKTENGRSRCFHVDIDENGNKIGIEAEPKMITACAAQRERDRYRHEILWIALTMSGHSKKSAWASTLRNRTSIR